MVSDRLQELRRRIDEIDERILELLNRRAQLARRIGEEKRQRGERLRCEHREREILERLLVNNRHFPPEGLRAVFREVFSACLSLQRPPTVCYLGPPATFTHQAALRRFGQCARMVASEDLEGVFRTVEVGEADYGVVPVENSWEGTVRRTLDAFVTSRLLVCGEVLLRISHHLLSRAPSLGEVRRVCSHPHALAQCARWLDRHLPTAERVGVASTALAARQAAEDPSCAAIAGQLAADIYGVPVLERHLEDDPQNLTRFWVIGRERVPPTGRDRTSLMVALRDEVGALHRALEPFAVQGVNLSKIESRPSRRAAWEYLFFLDLEGHAEDPPVRASLEALRERAVLLRVLGSYPRAEVVE